LRDEVTLQRRSGRRRVAEPKLFDGGGTNPAFGQLPPRSGARRGGELLPEKRRRAFVHLQQRFTQRGVPPPIVRRTVRFRDGDSELLREHPHGILESDFLVEFQELEDVAAGVAAKAMEKPLVGVNGERRGLLRVKRAQTL